MCDTANTPVLPWLNYSWLSTLQICDESSLCGLHKFVRTDKTVPYSLWFVSRISVTMISRLMLNFRSPKITTTSPHLCTPTYLRDGTLLVTTVVSPDFTYPSRYLDEPALELQQDSIRSWQRLAQDCDVTEWRKHLGSESSVRRVAFGGTWTGGWHTGLQIMFMLPIFPNVEHPWQTYKKGTCLTKCIDVDASEHSWIATKRWLQGFLPLWKGFDDHGDTPHAKPTPFENTWWLLWCYQHLER